MPFTPIKGTWADPDKVVCKDCIYRDHMTVKLPSGKVADAGTTRCMCAVYYEKPKGVLSTYKPTPCPFHKKETYALANPYIYDVNKHYETKSYGTLQPDLKFPLPCEMPAED